MNYYEHHIGDYDADTAHLSWAEDMAYTRLIRLYYRREKPIPADIGQVCRLVRASSREQRQAVDLVLREFFTLMDDGWHQHRCDEEILVYNKRCEHNHRVGRLGGRPRKKETQQEPDGFRSGSESETREEPERNPPHTPYTIPHTPDIKPGKETPRSNLARDPEKPPAGAGFPDPSPSEPSAAGPPHDPPPPTPTPAAAICQRLRSECGVSGVNPSHPKLLTLLAAGAQWGEFADAARSATGKSNPFAYVLSVVEHRRTDAAAMAGRLHAGPMPNRQEAVELRNRAVAEQWLRAPGAAA